MSDDIYQKPILVTGAAGFIGYHTIKELIRRGASNIIGLDNINDYYDTGLKYARLKELEAHSNIFRFEKADLADAAAINDIFARYAPQRVVHLAAQAGVRYSIDNPQVYTQSNLIGFMNMLEAVRNHTVEHMVYASSSSVYGANTQLPFATTDRTDHPVSLYAATKKSNEHLAFSYSSMYGLPLTGLRFFTVYGPFGRPDMAYFKFTQNIFNDQPITVYNNGDMMRDFTYVDDIVNGVIAALGKVPDAVPYGTDGAYEVPHKLYNIGHNNPENLGQFIEILEELIGKEARKDYLPIQTGDVLATYADIDDIQQDLGYAPQTHLKDGLASFVSWYKDYYKVAA